LLIYMHILFVTLLVSIVLGVYVVLDHCSFLNYCDVIDKWQCIMHNKMEPRMVIIHTNSSIVTWLCIFELFIRACPLVAFYQYLAHPMCTLLFLPHPHPLRFVFVEWALIGCMYSACIWIWVNVDKWNASMFGKQ
jgi:hypothetical protein